MVRRVLALLTVVTASSACIGLLPRTTLEGKPFNASQVQTVRYGLVEPDVRRLLGEPFEVMTDAQRTVWRYYERFTPRGCDFSGVPRHVSGRACRVDGPCFACRNSLGR